MSDVAVTNLRYIRNGEFLASQRMSAGGYRRGPARAHDVRRLRDMLRFAVLGGSFPGGQLPSEAELMAAHGASRATVRQVLAELRADTLIERTQGIGTHVVASTITTRMTEAHGVTSPGQVFLLDGRTRPRVLDRSVIPAPPTLAAALRVAAGTSCLRVDYVGLYDEEPFAIVTNYVLFPEAELLSTYPFRTDWYQFMADAGVAYGTSEFIIGSELTDATLAAELGVPEGTPVTSIEQTICDQAGRPFTVAFIYTLGRRFRFRSRVLRNPRGADDLD